MAEARRLLEGAVDTHVHSAPDLVERKLDDFETARQARERGMAAIVLKNHFLSTALRAQLVEQQVPDIRVIGSIVLNQPMGGMNPWAVEAAGRGGAKVVWMPTAHAANQIAHETRPGTRPHPAAMRIEGRDPAVQIFEADGSLTADAEAVLEVVRDRGMVLASGHLSADEVDRLTARARAMGLRKLVLTHPENPAIDLPVELQKRLVERGVFFERTYNAVTAARNPMPIEALAARIREVGPDSTILATDFGQPSNAPPADGLESYVSGLLANGFAEAEVRAMAGEHARGLLEI